MNPIKSIFIYLVLAVAFNGAVLAQHSVGGTEDKVVLYNWEGYIPDEIVTAFTKETGIKVEYLTYNNDELMYARTKIVKGRAYDVIVSPTDLVMRMRDEGLLQAIDHSRLEYFDQLEPKLLDQFYDPGNVFSIPYAWGSTGIVVNVDKLDTNKISRWEDLWAKQWRDQVLLIDSMREVFMIALTVNGHDINSTNEDEIKQAYEMLRRLLPNTKLISRTARSEFLSENVDLGILWSSSIVRIGRKNPALRYVYPEEGPLFWLSSFVIPARAANVDNALRFIDYILRPDVAARCVEIRGHTTATRVDSSLLDSEIYNNKAIFPPMKVLDQAKFPQDIGLTVKLYRRYWEKLKAEADKGGGPR
ncbi:MAG: extracellular solute-binding protein [Gammaproteobacteria bacterium]|nr:extracellular solute-binding protein [Gammaproteobacteria bacterium]